LEKGERRLKSHQTRQYHQFCAEKFDAFLKLCKNEENVDVRNMLSDSRKKSYIKAKLG